MEKRSAANTRERVRMRALVRWRTCRWRRIVSSNGFSRAYDRVRECLPNNKYINSKKQIITQVRKWNWTDFEILYSRPLITSGNWTLGLEGWVTGVTASTSTERPLKEQENTRGATQWDLMWNSEVQRTPERETGCRLLSGLSDSLTEICQNYLMFLQGLWESEGTTSRQQTH